MDSISSNSKVCTKCHVERSLDDYYFKNKATGELRSCCKVCHTAQNLAHQKNNPKQYAEYARIRRARDVPAARARERVSRERNRDALNAQARERAKRPDVQAKKAAYRLAKREERIAYNARYREEHKAERKAYNDAYYEANKEEVLERIKASIAKKPEKYKAIHARWKSENKAAANAITHRRRARLKHNGGSWTADDWERVKARFDWRCLMCGKQEMTDGITLCFDHVIPLSLGGFNIISNCQTLCRSCNSKKWRKVQDLRPDAY